MKAVTIKICLTKYVVNFKYQVIEKFSLYSLSLNECKMMKRTDLHDET